MSKPWLGIIADDVTGACDVAAAVREAGHATVLKLGVPELFEPLPACDVVVIGLRIRTVAPEEARGQARASAMWLRDRGARVFYQKYCSTFDSSPRGNIGPVADVLADLVGGWSATPPPARSVGTPATPAARRTQYQGHLFVGDRLLSESSLRDHPLTPMRQPDLVRVLAPQTRAPVRLVRWATVRQGPEALRRALLAAGDGERAGDGSPEVSAGNGPATPGTPLTPHVLVDALTDEDLDVVAHALLGLVPAASGDAAGRDGAGSHGARPDGPLPVVVGGGAGLAGALARAREAAHSTASDMPRVAPGQRLIVSGSLSEQTRAQQAAFRGLRLEVDPLDAGRAQSVEAVVDRLREAYADRPGAPVLVTASTEPARVRSYQERMGPDDAGRLVSGVLAEVAARAVRDLAVRRLIVAGGETSGAVTRALGVRSLHVGESVSPGVPWTVAIGTPVVALLLKSGNFGATDLFDRAWDTEP